MSLANPLWGAPRVHGELLKLGIDVSQTTVAKYMAKRRRPPSQGWRTFLHNHADGIASMDLFVVPTVSFRLLYGLLILQHGRRQILWLGVTAHPTAEWIARQLTEAYGWTAAPRYIVRDRDAVYGDIFIRRLRAMGIRDRPTAARSPWQNGYAERLIGSIRRDCLDNVVVLGERHLRHLLKSYQSYYNEVRTHLSLSKDAPVSRAVQAVGDVVAKTTPRRIAPSIRSDLIFGRDMSSAAQVNGSAQANEIYFMCVGAITVPMHMRSATRSGGSGWRREQRARTLLIPWPTSLQPMSEGRIQGRFSCYSSSLRATRDLRNKYQRWEGLGL